MSEIKSALLKSILTPTMMGIVITSMVGPYLITRVNGKMEDRKIQSALITQILEMTKQTDFSDEEQLKRYSVYAQIVKDNPDLFNINLEDALERANSLFSAPTRKKHQLETAFIELDSLESQKLAYGKKILNLYNDERFSGEGQHDAEEMQQAIDENAEKIKKIQVEIEYTENKIRQIEAEYREIKKGI